MTPLRLLTAIGASLVTVAPAAAQIAPGQDDDALQSPEFDDDALFAGAAAQVANDAELEQQRGGFALAGMDIRFGAEVQTYVNGELALMTSISWVDDIAVKTQYVSDQLSAATSAQLQNGVLMTGPITMRIGDMQVFLANAGQTALSHNLDDSLQTVLVNTASNVQFRTELNATLDLAGYQAFNASVQQIRLADALGSIIAEQTIGAVH